MSEHSTEIPRKRWKYRGVGPYVVGRWTGEFFDIYRGANTLEGARKARSEIRWSDAQIYDQVRDTYSGNGCA